MDLYWEFRNGFHAQLARVVEHLFVTSFQPHAHAGYQWRRTHSDSILGWARLLLTGLSIIQNERVRHVDVTPGHGPVWSFAPHPLPKGRAVSETNRQRKRRRGIAMTSYKSTDDVGTARMQWTWRWSHFFRCRVTIAHHWPVCPASVISPRSSSDSADVLRISSSKYTCLVALHFWLQRSDQRSFRTLFFLILYMTSINFVWLFVELVSSCNDW